MDPPRCRRRCRRGSETRARCRRSPAPPQPILRSVARGARGGASHRRPVDGPWRGRGMGGAAVASVRSLSRRRWCSSAPKLYRVGNRYDEADDTTTLHFRRTGSIPGGDGRGTRRSVLLPPGTQGRRIDQRGPGKGAGRGPCPAAGRPARRGRRPRAIGGRRRASARGARGRAVPGWGDGPGMGREQGGRGHRGTDADR